MVTGRRHIRTIRVDGDVAYVPLSQGMEAIIDAADVPVVGGMNWCANRIKGSIYAVRSRFADDGRHIGLMMHRLIMDAPAGSVVDHINGDGLDNRRENLRIATHAENLRNSRLSCRNTSGVKGVCWDKGHKKWAAFISVSGKVHRLGRFSDKGDAARAYAEASRRLHGEFGRTA